VILTNRTPWDDARVEQELRAFTAAVGHFPTSGDLRAAGRNDLMCATTKRGGLLAWSKRLGLDRRRSTCDFAWEGEEAFAAACIARGIEAVRLTAENVKAPYDLLLDGVLRADVKSARLARHDGERTAWHYRVAKHVPADVLALWQAETGDVVLLPWWVGPVTNISIIPGAGKYAAYLNAWPLLRRMIDLRKSERAAPGAAAVA
jgi:hypothetical protein